MNKQMIRDWKHNLWTVAFVGMGAIALPQHVNAHGVQIEYRNVPTIEILATYDSGEPLANAQVSVFAPNDLATPWLTGITDTQGQFMFVPDPAIAGNWDVQVRQAGHGSFVRIPVESVVSVSSTGTSIEGGASQTVSPIQKIVMATSVVWGFVGTALFFSARSKKHAHS